MPNINLIAARREEKRNVTTLSRQLFMGLVAAGVILAAVVIFFTGEQVQKRIQITNLDKDIATLQPKLDQIHKREADIAALKPKVDTLDNAKVATLRWRSMMGVVAEAMPDTVWITNMSTGGDIGGSTVNISGVGPSQAVVGEVARNLDQRGVFSHVDLLSTSNGSTPEDPVQKVSFQLNGYLLPATLSTVPPPVPATPTAETKKATMNHIDTTATVASAVKP